MAASAIGAEADGVPGGGGDALGYRDVFLILALLDNWPLGRIRYRCGALRVEALLDGDRTDAAGASGSVSLVTSPAVGLFRTVGHDDVSTAGALVGETSVLGYIEAPGRLTPVLAGACGRLSAVQAEEGVFVEYGQPLATVLREAQARNG